jgi:hypothetical protein
VQPLPIYPLSKDFIPYYVCIAGFFLLFTAYSLVQNLSVALFGTSIAIGIVYIFFIPSALFAPLMLTTLFKNDALFMMFVGSISYSLLTIACIFAQLFLLIITAALCGASAGLIWIGYSTTLTAYARSFAEKYFYEQEVRNYNEQLNLHTAELRSQRHLNPFAIPADRNTTIFQNDDDIHNNHDGMDHEFHDGHTGGVFEESINGVVNNSQIIAQNEGQNQSNSNSSPNGFDPLKQQTYINNLLLPNGRLCTNNINYSQQILIDVTTKKILGLLNSIAWAFLNLDVVFGGLFSYFILSSSTKPTPSEPDTNTVNPNEYRLSTVISQFITTRISGYHNASPISTLSGPTPVSSDVDSRPLFIVLAIASILANGFYYFAYLKSPKSLFYVQSATNEDKPEVHTKIGPENGKYNDGINSPDSPSGDFQLENGQDDEKNPLYVISRSLFLMFETSKQRTWWCSIPAWFHTSIPIAFFYTFFTAYYVKPILGTANIPLVMMMGAAVDSVTALIVSKLLTTLKRARYLSVFGSFLQLILISIIIVFLDVHRDSTQRAWVMSLLCAALGGFSDAFMQVPTNCAIGMVVDGTKNASPEVKSACFGVSTVFKSSGSIFIFLSGKYIGYTAQLWSIVVILIVSILSQLANIWSENGIDAAYLQNKYDGFKSPRWMRIKNKGPSHHEQVV